MQVDDPDRGIDEDHLSGPPAAGNVLELNLRTTQPDEPTGTLPFDQGAQGFLQEGAAILEA